MKNTADIKRELRRYMLLQSVVKDESALNMIASWIVEANARLLRAQAPAAGDRPPMRTLH